LSSVLVLLLLAGDLAGAQKALADGQPRKALELLGDLADGAEVETPALLVQGRAHFALGEYQAAVEPLMRASDALPQSKGVAREAALACRYSAVGQYRLLYLEDARRMAERAGDATLLADLYFEAGDYEAALAAYRELAKKKNRLHPLSRIAQCLEQLGKPDEAKTAYGEALEEALRIGDVRSAYRLAFAGGHRGRFLSWLDEKVASSKDLKYRRYRAYARAAALMFEEAVEDLRAVLKARPDDLDAKDLLSNVLLQLGVRRQREKEIDEAEKLARALLKGNPEHSAAWERLRWIAWRHWTNRNIEATYRIAKLLHETDPTHLEAGLNLAMSARRLGHYEESRTAYEGLMEEFREEPAVLNDYAILKDGMGDRAGAVELWKRVLVEEVDNLNALENLFTHSWEQGDRGAVAEYLRRGLAAARDQDEKVVERWIWFQDRLRWAPAGFGE